MAVTGGWWGVHWAVGWGSLEKKLGRGGLEGWPVRRRTGGGEWFWGGRAGVSAGAGGSAGGGLRFRGVEIDDKLEALDFVSNSRKI